MNALGFDISNYEGLLDWCKAKQAGIQFAFIKCTEGINWYAESFKRNWEMASTHNILKGAYHYYKSGQDPVKQAEWFLSKIDALSCITTNTNNGDLPHAVDLEEMISFPPSNFARKVRLCLETIETETGRRPIIYTNLSFWVSMMKYATWGDRYPLWIANPRMNAGPTVPSPWAPCDWRFWQYSWAGDPLKYGVPIGGKKAIDLDCYNGSIEDLKRWLSAVNSGFIK